MRRTGLKTLFWKLIKFIKFPHNFLFSYNTEFPKNGLSSFNHFLWMITLKNEIKTLHSQNALGYLYNKPHPFSVNVWKKFIYLNPNNLGLWSNKDPNLLLGTRKSEHTLILKIINLLGGKDKEWEGFVTSGATESNIFFSWMGRNYLKNKIGKKIKICLISNQLAHYSIRKAANIVNLPIFNIDIDRKSWTINSKVLERKIIDLKEKGYKGFLIPLTLGYTQTGTNDDYIKISKLLEKIQSKLDIKCFVWIDAAINGLILPFLDNSFAPLKISSINAFVLDFHKNGMCPIPSGVIVYKSFLRKSIEQKVEYLDQDDSTLLGSRPGVSASAMLALINKLGKSGFKKLILRSISDKKKFLSIIESQRINLEILEIIEEKNGTSLTLVSKKVLPKQFVEKYGLFAKKCNYKFEKKSENLYLYKTNFITKA